MDLKDHPLIEGGHIVRGDTSVTYVIEPVDGSIRVQSIACDGIDVLDEDASSSFILGALNDLAEAVVRSAHERVKR